MNDCKNLETYKVGDTFLLTKNEEGSKFYNWTNQTLTIGIFVSTEPDINAIDLANLLDCSWGVTTILQPGNSISDPTTTADPLSASGRDECKGLMDGLAALAEKCKAGNSAECKLYIYVTNIVNNTINEYIQFVSTPESESVFISEAQDGAVKFLVSRDTNIYVCEESQPNGTIGLIIGLSVMIGILFLIILTVIIIFVIRAVRAKKVLPESNDL